MTSPARFSWTETVRTLGRPGPPPPGLVRAGTLLLGFCVAAVLVLIGLGYQSVVKVIRNLSPPAPV